MDKAEFDEAVDVARQIRATVEHLLQDPARTLANLARREIFDRDVIEAWAREASDPVRRRIVAAQAVNLVQPGRNLEPPKKQGQAPGKCAVRDAAALAAMWFLIERLGLKTPTRNDGSEPLSVCDAVAKASAPDGPDQLGYKTAKEIWRSRAALFRENPLIFLALWAEMPAASALGISREIIK